MENQLTENQLSRLTKKDIIMMYMSLQKLAESLTAQCEAQSKQLNEVNQKMNLLIEQIGLGKQQRFGRSSEKMNFDDDQLQWIFNEAEVTIACKCVVEPTLGQVCPQNEETETITRRKPRPVGKREEDLKGFPVKVINHILSDELLKEKFGDAWRRLPDEVYKRLACHPATFEVEEHHVAVYCGKDNQTIIKAKRPASLLRNSIVTPSLAAGILNGKYVNAVPLYRQEQEFKRNGVNISRSVMASWTIACAERYFSLLYERLHQELLKCDICQADETTVEVTKDGRSAGSKSYMWVYRTGKMYDANPIILYDYQKTRKADHPKTFLKDYKGVLVTDGYQVYHTMDNKDPDITVAGCWSHARRHFATLVKSLGKEKAKGTLANDALQHIAAIYKVENTLAQLTTEERYHQRNLIVKPLVEAFFVWLKKHQGEVLSGSETGKGFSYCLNQEKYLKVFLTNGNIPIDNNCTEQAIRGFCIGRQNWRLIDTVAGAKASGIIYSIAETAKANNLKPYNYFELLLDVIPQHMDDKNLDFLETLLPWSDQIPETCHKQ